jgi:uncharacterized protein (DUF924 family)
MRKHVYIVIQVKRREVDSDESEPDLTSPAAALLLDQLPPNIFQVGSRI